MKSEQPLHPLNLAESQFPLNQIFLCHFSFLLITKKRRGGKKRRPDLNVELVLSWFSQRSLSFSCCQWSDRRAPVCQKKRWKRLLWERRKRTPGLDFIQKACFVVAKLSPWLNILTSLADRKVYVFQKEQPSCSCCLWLLRRSDCISFPPKQGSSLLRPSCLPLCLLCPACPSPWSCNLWQEHPLAFLHLCLVTEGVRLLRVTLSHQSPVCNSSRWRFKVKWACRWTERECRLADHVTLGTKILALWKPVKHQDIIFST